MTTQTKKRSTMYKQIQQHGENLNAIFNTGIEPIALCKKLRRLELKATYWTTLACNTGNDYEVELGKILTAAKKILFPDVFNSNQDLYKSVFINGDPRGYALKVNDKHMRLADLRLYQDWGGYGIIAPDFTPNS